MTLDQTKTRFPRKLTDEVGLRDRGTLHSRTVLDFFKTNCEKATGVFPFELRFTEIVTDTAEPRNSLPFFFDVQPRHSFCTVLIQLVQQSLLHWPVDKYGQGDEAQDLVQELLRHAGSVPAESG